MVIQPGMYQVLKKIVSECEQVERCKEEAPGDRTEEDINNEFYDRLDTIKAHAKDILALMGTK